MTGACQKLLSDSLLLILTGLKRHVSTSLEEHLKATNEEKLDKDPQHLAALATQAVTRLEGNSPDPMLREFGAMIHEGWKIKKALSSNISNPYNDQHYEQALRGGALGGKLSGAGNGGFLLMIVPPHEHDRLREAVKPAPVIKIGLDVHGSTILYS
jgi:D-glycero-alpha-D-manno-heptose-7-phosphate kinase